MTTLDNQLAILTSGQSDWDADTDLNFNTLERGYHVTQRAGVAINTGEVLWCNSAGFFKQFDPNSASIFPMAMAFTAAASGDSMRALAWGIVRSLAINSAGVPGKPLWVSAATPGVIVGSSAIQNIPIGLGLPSGGVLFSPARLSAASLGGGVTKVTSLSDVNPAGLADGSILKWSNSSSKFIMAVDSTGGGGGTDVGSPPGVVQFAFGQATNNVTFATTPTSGNLLVAITFDPTNSTAVAGWTKAAENGAGTDFGDLWTKALTAPGTLVQTPVAGTTANMTIVMWELHGGKGVPPTFLASGLQAESTSALAGATTPLPNLRDCISLHGMSLVSASNSMNLIYNVTSQVLANSGTARQLAAGWSWSDRAIAQMMVSFTGTGAPSYKGITALFTS